MTNRKILLYVFLLLGILYLYSAFKAVFSNAEVDEYELFFNWKVGKTLYFSVKTVLGIVFVTYAIGNLMKKKAS